MSKTTISTSKPHNPWLAMPAGIGLVLWFQFSREISRGLNGLFYQILSVKAIARPVYWLQGITGYNVYSTGFWSKIVYSVCLLGLIALTLWLYARTRSERKFSLGLPVLALGMAIVLNVLGKLAGSQWIETFSRDTFEFILSPLPVVFIIPALTLMRLGQPGKKKGLGSKGKATGK